MQENNKITKRKSIPKENIKKRRKLTKDEVYIFNIIVKIIQLYLMIGIK